MGKSVVPTKKRSMSERPHVPQRLKRIKPKLTKGKTIVNLKNSKPVFAVVGTTNKGDKVVIVTCSTKKSANRL